MSNQHPRRPTMDRRRVLRGIGGITLGLPALDAFVRKAQAAPLPVPSLFFVTCNGVMQRWEFGDPGEKFESFWPRAGDGNVAHQPFSLPITRAMLEADRSSRTVGDLAAYADRLLLIKGIDHPFPAKGDSHHIGNVQVLTAANVSAGNSMADQQALGESIDNRIARVLNPDRRDSVVLHAGESKGGGGGSGVPSAVSSRGARMPRPAESSPMNAYTRMVGMDQVAPELAGRVQRGRTSVNDLLRVQIKRMMARPELSAADRRRLERHFSAVRDLEVKLSASLPPSSLDGIKAVSGREHSNDNHDKVLRLQFDLAAFALTSGYTRTAVVKAGDVNDRTRWNIDGKVQPVFHMISHRVMSDGGSGPAIDDATALHAKIDRIQMGHFKYFLDAIADVQTPTGPFIDTGFFCFTNQVGTGKYHTFRDIPWVVVGGARGYLRTGLFVNVNPVFVKDSERAKSQKLLTTLLAAAGVRQADGSPVQDFGDASLPRGVLSEIIKQA